jgi:hypothetical protein
MSARMETETWEETIDRQDGNDWAATELESVLRNSDQRTLVTPLREARANLETANGASQATTKRAALALQDRWNSWLGQREVLREEIKRGREYLEQAQQELNSIRAGLEEWTGYERECGKNPLLQYTQSLTAKEQVVEFLPSWLKRREERLTALIAEMESCARQNGMEHLLTL